LQGKLFDTKDYHKSIVFPATDDNETFEQIAKIGMQWNRINAKHVN